MNQTAQLGRTVQFRRGTAAEWNAINPILLAGEIGFERDVPSGIDPSPDTFSYSDPAFGSGAIKIGDGITRWKDLPYLLNSLRFAGATDWSGLTNKPTSFPPTPHAVNHAANGSDPLLLSADQITTGVFAASRLGGGAATADTFLRGDGQWRSVVTTVIDGGSASTAGDQVLDGGSATTA